MACCNVLANFEYVSPSFPRVVFRSPYYDANIERLALDAAGVEACVVRGCTADVWGRVSPTHKV